MSNGNKLQENLLPSQSVCLADLPTQKLKLLSHEQEASNVVSIGAAAPGVAGAAAAELQACETSDAKPSKTFNNHCTNLEILKTINPHEVVSLPKNSPSETLENSANVLPVADSDIGMGSNWSTLAHKPGTRNTDETETASIYENDSSLIAEHTSLKSNSKVSFLESTASTLDRGEDSKISDSSNSHVSLLNSCQVLLDKHSTDLIQSEKCIDSLNLKKTFSIYKDISDNNQNSVIKESPRLASIVNVNDPAPNETHNSMPSNSTEKSSNSSNERVCNIPHSLNLELKSFASETTDEKVISRKVSTRLRTRISLSKIVSTDVELTSAVVPIPGLETLNPVSVGLTTVPIGLKPSPGGLCVAPTDLKIITVGINLSEEDSLTATCIKNCVLYDVPIETNQVPIIYRPEYNITLFGLERLHPFDSGKWGKVIQVIYPNPFLKLIVTIF